MTYYYNKEMCLQGSAAYINKLIRETNWGNKDFSKGGNLSSISMYHKIGAYKKANANWEYQIVLAENDGRLYEIVLVFGTIHGFRRIYV